MYNELCCDVFTCGALFYFLLAIFVIRNLQFVYLTNKPKDLGVDYLKSLLDYEQYVKKSQTINLIFKAINLIFYTCAGHQFRSKLFSSLLLTVDIKMWSLMP